MKLKWLYKIYSNYDGFRPAVIPMRMRDGDVPQLGWERYLDDVETGDDLWIYFHGSHRFANGVYAKGSVRRIARKSRHVVMRVGEYSTDEPLTDAETSARVAAVVATRNRQVFLFPTELQPIPSCDLATSAAACAARLCDTCPTWNDFPQIRPSDVASPERIGGHLKHVASAYWIIPARCYLYADHKAPAASVRRISETFRRFKTGDAHLAYPLALGMQDALRQRNLLDIEFNAVVPIPCR